MIEECDVYVYELTTSDPSDLEYVCSIFKNPLEEQKVNNFRLLLRYLL